MSQFSNSSIIERLPDNHFGEVGSKVMNNLLNGLCAVVYGIPGYGMDYFAKHMIYRIKKTNSKIYTIYLNLDLENDKKEVFDKEMKRIIETDHIDEINIGKFLSYNKIVVALTGVYNPNYPNFFRYIGAVRELNHNNFTVLTVANYTVHKNSQEYLQNGRHIFFPSFLIPNFDVEGVKRIIEINNEQYKWNTPLSLLKKIYFLSGGNPALVRNICMAVNAYGEKTLQNLKKLIKFESLGFRLAEIAELVTKLTIEEQIEIGLLNSNGTLFSGLLTEYLKESEIGVLDKIFPDLTRKDRKILGVFLQNPGIIIDKDQLSLILDQSVDTYSEWAIYKAIERVREKVKDKYQIKTLKGKGWRLEVKK